MTVSQSHPAPRVALQHGADPTAPIRGKTPLYWLIEMYTRSSRFAECVRVMLDAGAKLEDSRRRCGGRDSENRWPAQRLLETEQGERLMHELPRFLSKAVRD